MYKCKCGSVFFTCGQLCTVWHDIIVNGNAEFIADIDGSFNPVDTEKPEGPFICMKCGAKYEDLYALEDDDIPNDYGDRAHDVWEESAKMRVKDLNSDELLAAYEKQRMILCAEDAHRYCKDNIDRPFDNNDCEAIAEIFISSYRKDIPEDEQMCRAAEKWFNKEV